MKFLDTNIILRYLTEDDSYKAKRCDELFKKISSGKETLFTSTLVITEVVWVLEKVYRLTRDQITVCVQKILNTPHIECDEKDILLTAVGLYALKPIDFIDAYNAILMQTKDIQDIYSYDTHFDLFPALKRIEP